MKSILMIFGILLIVAGGIWFFQGINVIQGSSMTGQSRWAIYGGIAVVVGIGLVIFTARKKAAPRA